MLFGLMFLSALAEVISLGAVIPFIGVLAAPDVFMAQPLVAKTAGWFGVVDAADLVFPLTMLFVCAAIFAGVVRILFSWLSTRLTFATGADISIEVYRRALYQPYQVHVNRSSSEMISGITGKVGHTTLGVMLPLLTLAIAVVLLVSIVTALMFINPFVATIAAAAFGLSYGTITWVTRRRLDRNSHRIAAEHTNVVQALQEGLGGIRDVLLHGTQPVYCEVYRAADLRWRLAQGENVFIAQSPRFAMEAIGMILIAVLALGLSRTSGGLVSALPVLGALALGAQRLLPAIQQGYAAWVSIAGSKASFADTIELLDQPLPESSLQPPPEPLSFGREIRFAGVGFRYVSDSPDVLADINLSIPRGARVGFVGSTGSGKSTLMDLLMGLLPPTDGQILIDGNPLVGDNVRAWQQTIAHVPQNIFLSDATLADNIALGVKAEDIDYDRVRQAAEQAQIAEFIESRDMGYEALVGERGVRLSGGQRQRIGIARALYKRASVLIFDEATSSLDHATERSVMEAIGGLDRNLTILLIAHRLTTVQNCDRVFELEAGRVVGEGSYDELLARSPSFLRLARLSKS